MKLIYYNLSLEINLRTSELNYWIIENADQLDKMIQAVDNRFHKKESNIELFEDTDKLDFTKLVDLIYSPIDVTYDKKDIQKHLLSELLEEVQSSEIVEKFIAAKVRLIDAIDDLRSCTEYDLDLDENIGTDNLLKSFDVRLKGPEGRFIERVIEYIENMHRLLGKKIFILVGCKGYFKESDYRYIRECAEYQGVYILFIEASQYKLPDDGNKYIIDEDLCELH
ncbi:MAG: type II-A CRISPR-associated protein Csn2 [Clostridiales bacterium]|nr:type II-A CRISPR-associated protein Csn2 [Clostridiales bacterium]MBS5877402.1 type II-A CRISPR-associated protein Csn2 [Clostridiales bacterium]